MAYVEKQFYCAQLPAANTVVANVMAGDSRAVITGMVLANPSATASTVDVYCNGVAVTSVSVGPGSVVSIDNRFVLTGAQTMTAKSSVAATATLAVSGLEVTP